MHRLDASSILQDMTLGKSINKNGDFDVYHLKNDRLVVEVVPELGAKITSIFDKKANREWLWAPDASRKLFRSKDKSTYEASSLLGIDECCPSVVSWQNYPDHGELWSRAWNVDPSKWVEQSIVETTFNFEGIPVTFTRSLELVENTLLLSYEAQNSSDLSFPFLWCIHPLIQIRAGDQIQLGEGSGWTHFTGLLNCLDDEPQLAEKNPVDSSILIDPNTTIKQGVAGYLKGFVKTPDDGVCKVKNAVTDEELRFEMVPEQLPSIGIWINRGGWNGFHHIGIEPTTYPNDFPERINEEDDHPMLAAKETKNWSLRISV